MTTRFRAARFEGFFGPDSLRRGGKAEHGTR